MPANQQYSLTAIHRTRSSSSRGNVHTGAVPPWLQNDDDDSEMLAIGPSEKLFRTHLASKKKGSKNPKRVGAEFMENRKHMKQDDDTWLPSFGRVWNHGPRLHSKLEYMDESGLRKSRKRQKDFQETEHNLSYQTPEKQTDLSSNLVADRGEMEVCMNQRVQHSSKQWPLTSTVDTRFSINRPFVSTILPDSSAIISQQTHACLQPSTIPSQFGGLLVSLQDKTAVKRDDDGCSAGPSRMTWPNETNRLSLLSETLLKQREELLQSLNRKKRC